VVYAGSETDRQTITTETIYHAASRVVDNNLIVSFFCEKYRVE